VLVTVVHVLVGTMKIYTQYKYYTGNSCLIGSYMVFTFSFVASMLEVARLTLDSGWVPPRPIVFLFNGAEELFLLVSHHGTALSGRKIILTQLLFLPALFSLA
jgi:hypothetical protein